MIGQWPTKFIAHRSGVVAGAVHFFCTKIKIYVNRIKFYKNCLTICE
nr:MAG TPA: hypothetical protein [Caudoviricetes sp.]